MKVILMLVFFLLVSGCVRPKANTPKIQEIEECKEIDETGDMRKLLSDIRKDVDEVLRLLEQPSVKTNEQVHILAQEVAHKSTKVQFLSKPEWTTPKWDHEIQWDLTLNSNLTSAKVVEVYFMGTKRTDLISHFELDIRQNNVSVSYRNQASSLEICQLEESYVVILEVKSRGRIKTKRSLFSLYVRHQKENYGK